MPLLILACISLLLLAKAATSSAFFARQPTKQTRISTFCSAPLPPPVQRWNSIMEEAMNHNTTENHTYKHLFRHYDDISMDCWLRCAEPREFLLTCGYTDKDVDRMAQEFPHVLSNKPLFVFTNLAPKLRFIVKTLGGGTGDLLWSTSENQGVTAEECLIQDETHMLRVNNVAKRAIPTEFFGMRLERTIGPRHAYLVYAGLPHGRDLLYNQGKRFKEFLRVCNTRGNARKSAQAFANMCLRWTNEIRRPFSASTLGTDVHTADRILAFERAFHQGLEVVARNQWTSNLLAVGETCTPGRMMELLLLHGANHLEHPNDDAVSHYLHWSAFSGNVHGTQALLATMKENKEDIDSVLGIHAFGGTPLHWAACGVESDQQQHAVLLGPGDHAMVCNSMLNSARNTSALVNSQSLDIKDTPLMWAMRSNNLSVANVLLAHGADPHDDLSQ